MNNLFETLITLVIVTPFFYALYCKIKTGNVPEWLMIISSVSVFWLVSHFMLTHSEGSLTVNDILLAGMSAVVYYFVLAVRTRKSYN